MTVEWLLEDPKEALANFLCAECQTRINKGEEFYLAKRKQQTIKLCEECASAAEVQSESPDREDWEL